MPCEIAVAIAVDFFQAVQGDQDDSSIMMLLLHPDTVQEIQDFCNRGGCSVPMPEEEDLGHFYFVHKVREMAKTARAIIPMTMYTGVGDGQDDAA